jgi:membrane associated rhomboid family serine protease
MSLDYQPQNENEEPHEKVIRAVPIKPYFSIVLVAIIVIVSIFEVVLDLKVYRGLSTEAFRSLILFGSPRTGFIAGFDKVAFRQGDYWRILTSAMLHAGVIHLAFNSYALYVLGRLIETLSNWANLLVVFVISVIGGNVLSLIFSPNSTSVGASGGIIGFLGYLTIYGFYRRKLMSNSLVKNMLFNVVFIGIMGVYVLPNVDNFAHLGGLLTGAVYGIFQIPRDLYADPREASETAKIAGFAALGIVLFVAVLTVVLLVRGVHL